MKIYLLKRKTATPVYDVYNGHVIVAKSPQRARTMAAEQAGDEKAATWLDPNTSSCEILGTPLEGEIEHIALSDFHAG